MRLEVRSAGIAAILICVTLLSGAVFVMGLLAGYDIGHQSQLAAQQVVTSYPLQVPPADQANQNVASNTARSPIPGGPASTPRAQAPSVGKTMTASVPAIKPETVAKRTDYASNPPRRGVTESDDEGGDTAAEPAPVESLAPKATPRVANLESTPAPMPRHRPYNIQIQAAMDSSSAGEMVRRLEGLGYRPHLIPTNINGSTWYKVEVGPYATQADAAAAEISLRQKYNNQYGHGAAAPGAGSTDEDE
jgi:DedD protein